ncbi:MAG: hypothetical protein ACLTDR_08700 [Adlercreutzia equolifaciens]
MSGACSYQSPTDMGVNMAGIAIVRRCGVPRGERTTRSCAAISRRPRRSRAHGRGRGGPEEASSF